MDCTFSAGRAMDKLANYRKILCGIINEYAGYKPRNSPFDWVPICDDNNEEYLLMSIGWDEKRKSQISINFSLSNQRRQNLHRTRQYRCQSCSANAGRRRAERRHRAGILRAFASQVN